MKTTQKSPNQKIAKIILIVLAVSAALAGLSGLFDLADAPKNTLAVETWRVVGFFTFAELFGLLAKRPDSSRELWGIVLANKLALSIFGVFFLVNGGVSGARDFVIFDGSMTILLIVAGMLQGVWKQKPAK